MEGFYSIGKIFGNVKEYYKEEKIKFDGIWKKGKRKGKGKEFYYDGKLNSKENT